MVSCRKDRTNGIYRKDLTHGIMTMRSFSFNDSLFDNLKLINIFNYPLA
jgi:hypothetical protein